MGKIPVNITVDKDILEKFKDHCENNDIKVSTKINTLMKEWLDSQKNGKK
jgi:antitoxin component of RelBE/YafQ-DinJ toxin-antitoxin module